MVYLRISDAQTALFHLCTLFEPAGADIIQVYMVDPGGCGLAVLLVWCWDDGAGGWLYLGVGCCFYGVCRLSSWKLLICVI